MMACKPGKNFSMTDVRFRNGVPMSPLMLSHQLLALAEDADRAGLRRSASDLVELALRVCSDRLRKPVRSAAVVTLPANVTRLNVAAVA